MNELRTFTYNNAEVRTVEMNGDPWFVLKDVCGILGISNATVAASRLDEDEVTKFDLGGKVGITNIINESGLYSVILRSDKPEAKPFRKWVTSEVLPAIRKTGTYTILPTENIEPQAAYTGSQRLGDVVELAKLTARLMKDSKRIPSDILYTVGAQLEGFGVVMPDGFYLGMFSPDAAAERSVVVSQFLSEFGSVLDRSVGEVYNEYLDYCHRTGNVPISSTYAFGREVVKHTGTKTKTAHRNGKVMRVYTN